MKRNTIFFQVVVVLIGIGALALMLWEPRIEGRNAHATNFEIYFKDLFLAYAYIASIAFFAALYQAFKLLGYVRQNKIFSQAAVKALRTIKYCAMILIAFIVGAEGYLFIVQRKVEEDIAGGVMMGLVMIFISVVVAAGAAMFEGILQNAMDIKSENKNAEREKFLQGLTKEQREFQLRAEKRSQAMAEGLTRSNLQKKEGEY